MSKKETVEEFLARGGKITKVEYSEPNVKEIVNSAPTSGYSSIMTYDSADLYYGDPKKTSASRESTTKSKKQPNIDFSVLPPELQKSLLEQLASHGEE
jgi:hypothetical protein